MGITLPEISPNKLAVLGLLILFSPLYFIGANILKYELGIPVLAAPLGFFYAHQGLFNAVSPFVLLGSLTLAIAINLYPVVRIGVRREADSIVGTISVKARWSNLAVAALSGLLLTMLLGYVLVENIGHLVLSRLL